MYNIIAYAFKYVISFFTKQHHIHSAEASFILYSKEFTDFWESLPYYTYNKNIPINDANVTARNTFSDVGWGCCIRSTQMATSRALSKLLTKDENDSLFNDLLGAPLGIQHFYKIGTTWGPASCAKMMETLSKSLKIPILSFPDGVIIVDEIDAVLQRSSFLILFISQRLSTDYFNIAHVDTLTSLFKHPEFVGLIGGDLWGKGYFFPAANETYLVGLDPHYVQDATKADRLKPTKPKILFWELLNPTITLVFTISRNALRKMLQLFEQISQQRYPPFEFVQERAHYESIDAEVLTQF